MKKLLAMVCLLAAAPLLRATDSAVEEKVKVIRGKYTEIERELKHCRQVKRDLPDESAEGGELTAYFKGPSLKKLSAKLFGETGKLLEEYYFADNDLIFVLRFETRYTGPNSGVVRNKTEQRLYFAGGKLIRWLDGGKPPAPMNGDAEMRGRELMDGAAKYSGMVRR